MASSLKIRCDCGAVQGIAFDVSPSSGNHVICYCDDCQAFAHFLGRQREILDSSGGSDIFQMSQGRVAFKTGTEHLACLRLTPKGLVRWYASCCNAPIANTMATRALPFVGLVTTCLEETSENTLAIGLGPVIAHIYRKFANGDPATIPPDRVALPLVFLRAVALLLKWKIRGDSKLSAFFDPNSRKVIATPRVLNSAEHADLKARVAGGF